MAKSKEEAVEETGTEEAPSCDKKGCCNGKGALVIVAIAVAAIGGYFIMDGSSETAPKLAAVEASASSEDQSPTLGQQADAAQAEEKQAGMVIEPGNPVVAKVGDKAITRVDVFNFIQQLPPQTRQLPLEQLFPLAQQQLINASVMNAQKVDASLENDPEVIAQIEAAKQQILRNVNIQKKVEEALTEERMAEIYAAYVEQFPAVTEVKASHILVNEESAAKEILAKLNDGADFAELAKESSSDATAEAGGDLGYFLKTDVVPEFGEAAFSLKAGEYTKEAVKSQFGYHIIKVEDSRTRPVPDLESVRPFLESQLRQALLTEVVNEWTKEATIERFDINGNAIEPAAGE